jgi:hypothetical protein
MIWEQTGAGNIKAKDARSRPGMRMGYEIVLLTFELVVFAGKFRC